CETYNFEIKNEFFINNESESVSEGDLSNQSLERNLKNGMNACTAVAKRVKKFQDSHSKYLKNSSESSIGISKSILDSFNCLKEQ
ncbi:MAG: hypothetical protein MHPSP_002289, partial [Paramarteilia canceri]